MVNFHTQAGLNSSLKGIFYQGRFVHSKAGIREL